MTPLRVIKPGLDDSLYGAQDIHLDGYTITVFVNRVTDEKRIKKYNKDFGLAAKPPLTQVIRKFGFKIELAYDGVKIYRNTDFPISQGGKRWVFNIKKPNHKVSVLYAVSLEVVKNDKPIAVNFDTKHQIDAAIAVYRRRIDEAEVALRDEIHRIALNSIEKAVSKPQVRNKVLKKG